MEGFSLEWDAVKAQKNVATHGVAFEEAATVFYDPLLITFFDEEHSDTEQRFLGIGRSDHNRILLVVYTDRDDAIRIISCRKATAAERKTYERRTS